MAAAANLSDTGRLITLRGPIRGLLLCTTKPDRWRRPLRDFLNDYILEMPLKESLHFLEQMIGEARALKHREPNQLHFVPVDEDYRPAFFHVDRWRQLMSSLGFMLEEPDTNMDVGLCSVFVHEMMAMPVLTGFHVLLQCLLVLNYYQIRSLLSLSAADAHIVMDAVIGAVNQVFDPQDGFHHVWLKHKEFLEGLGFRRTTARGRSEPKFVYNEGHGRHCHCNLPEIYAVLLCLYGAAVDTVDETPL